ncbi:protein Niban 1-like isoform X2 [Siniperca chuatsi]|uniref:protein Niban 1-like isoform X2 n=1 Tax=Siniperca chuatsi TaxID=119488 RepID=UPI001CE0391E|nr:protein Niban 1-like isoform X2 [Siniperca chuatsi]
MTPPLCESIFSPLIYSGFSFNVFLPHFSLHAGAKLLKCSLSFFERAEHIADIMETLAPLYRRHLSSNLLTHMRNKHMEPTESRPLIQHPDPVAHAEIVLEGTLPQYLDGIWSHRHLQVTSSFTVESRDSKQVFEGGWECKTELVLSGCHICTFTQEHRELVDDMCRHIKGMLLACSCYLLSIGGLNAWIVAIVLFYSNKHTLLCVHVCDFVCMHTSGKPGGKLACWNCPTAFPVFIQQPYSAPVCLAAASYQEQTRWANILRAATQHQSSGTVLLSLFPIISQTKYRHASMPLLKLFCSPSIPVIMCCLLALWCEDSPESRAFLDAVSSLKKLRGNCQTEVYPMGSGEEVLVSMVMEEVMPYLKEQVFPRIIIRHSRKRKAWIGLLSEVYRTAKHQVKAAMAALKEDLLLYRSDVEKLISAELQQASLLQDYITHTITEDMCEPMLQSLLHKVIPSLDRTLQEVETPTCEAFASIWQYFLEKCDSIIDLGSTGTSVKDIKKEALTPLSGLGPDDARMWQCLDRLELSSEGRTWLQETWGVHSGTWRPLVVDMCALMFWRLVARYPCFSFDSSQLTAVLCRVKERVIKQLDTELLALRSQFILEMSLQITLPAFTRAVGEQDLSRYYAMVNSEHALFIHPDTIFHSILRDNLSSYIQSVMRYSVPQQFMPLPVSPSNPCSSSSSFSVPEYHELLPPGDCRCQQSFCQPSKGSTSGSDTLKPNTRSDWDDTQRPHPLTA